MNATERTFVDPVGRDVTSPLASRWRRWRLPLILAAVLVALLATGLWPRFVQNRRLANAGANVDARRPRVTVVPVRAGPASIDLQLPGGVEALTEVAIHTRADGYVRRRLVDIGDRVRTGQLLAEIESPELAEQIQQAEATEQRARAGLRQTEAAADQARANLALAQVTMERWQALVGKGVLSKQDGDEKETAYRARQAEVAAGEANITAAQEGLRAGQADRRRLVELQGFRQIRAPFDGIITVRNTEVGALVNAGSSAAVVPLFRLAALDRLRVQAYVPQSEVVSIRVGLPCEVAVPDLPGRTFTGRITRTAQALDPSSRTLLTEVVVANPEAALLPGMSAIVRITLRRDRPPLLIPAAAFRTGDGGPRVAVIDGHGRVRFRRVRLGRDNGAQVEVLEGVAAGERVATTISDDLREGTAVEAVAPSQAGNLTGLPWTEVRWANELFVRSHLLPIDTTVHWCYSLHGGISANGEDYSQYSIRKDGVPIITHLHGGHSEFQFDGNPEFFYSPGSRITGPQWDFVPGGFTNLFRYDNDVPAGSLWYHDHALGITRLNVYAGLAGFYFVRDEWDTGEPDNALGLPAFPYELAYAIQDRMFTNRGELFIPRPLAIPCMRSSSPKRERSSHHGSSLAGALRRSRSSSAITWWSTA